jgi:hypothetical protein
LHRVGTVVQAATGRGSDDELDERKDKQEGETPMISIAAFPLDPTHDRR